MPPSMTRWSESSAAAGVPRSSRAKTRGSFGVGVISGDLLLAGVRGAAETHTGAAVHRTLGDTVIGTAVVELPGIPGASGDQHEIGLVLAGARRPLAGVSGHAENPV